MQFWIVAAIIAVALFFDYVNGFHDAANSIATVVSTRVLSPGKAVIWAAFFNFVAAFTFGTAVASTVGKGTIEINTVTFAVILGGLTGAIVWDIITWYFGLPTSSSHALIGGYAGGAGAPPRPGGVIPRGRAQEPALVGGYAGGAVAHAGLGVIIPSGWTKTLIFIVLAPTIGLVLGFVLMTAI